MFTGNETHILYWWDYDDYLFSKIHYGIFVFVAGNTYSFFLSLNIFYFNSLFSFSIRIVILFYFLFFCCFLFCDTHTPVAVHEILKLREKKKIIKIKTMKRCCKSLLFANHSVTVEQFSTCNVFKLANIRWPTMNWKWKITEVKNRKADLLKSS